MEEKYLTNKLIDELNLIYEDAVETLNNAIEDKYELEDSLEYLSIYKPLLDDKNKISLYGEMDGRAWIEEYKPNYFAYYEDDSLYNKGDIETMKENYLYNINCIMEELLF